MARFIESPTVVDAAGHPPKRIEEFVGRANTPDRAELSVARMASPGGWSEPGQTPDFDEVTLVLAGSVRVETREETFTVGAGQAFLAEKGEWVRYSTPGAEGAQYVSVCLPAFSPDAVHRDEG